MEREKARDGYQGIVDHLMWNFPFFPANIDALVGPPFHARARNGRRLDFQRGVQDQTLSHLKFIRQHCASALKLELRGTALAPHGDAIKNDTY